MGSVQPPTKPCHNCRRQRLRCDRSYPHCNKCAASGKECLGYGKLFRWTGAIASRGKLAGRTSSAPVEAGEEGEDGEAEALSPVLASANVRFGRASPSSPRGSESAWDGRFGRRSSTGAGALQFFSHPRPPGPKLSSSWALVDPLFQDLDQSHRFYLNYFTTRLCKDLVSNDGPECNPFRSLIPLTRAHPLLQHIIVAASAAHMSNLMSMGLPYPDDGGLIPANQDAASKKALNDALVAKHTALRLMSAAIQNLDTINGDVVLAASLFFINVELIESGKYGWRAHLEGAAKIMSFLQLTKAWDSSLRDYLLSDCFIYFILASAFMPARYATSLNFESSQIPFVLGKTVANSYLCCPAELMEILHAASQLSNSLDDDQPNEDITMAAIELIGRAQAYDIHVWARDTAGSPSLSNDVMKSRMHAGSTHRLAACIYILQAIPSVGERLGPEFAAFLTDDLLAHLTMIPVEDPNFKATTWPTFIIGAETRDPERQKLIMERLRVMTTVCPWGFIHTAMDTLQVIWNLAAEERGSKSWVQALKDPEMNFLIV
ncbi:Zn2Cys6 transcriptional regulator [Trichoderma cornu-damae]|uniref:Zn2Cys6 transcriptional regulator n=1 Tax=Trichoderma cornu-damae TaxID=654480 RepID=A0A9P8TVI4_9HYPO|nr:Zn2Cys6 transcriptional regulator [Trichoderma cornu-damae]